MIHSIQKRIKDFFSQGHERTILTKKNIAASFGVKGITILISLIVVPLTIGYLDKDRYGVFITLTSMVTWLGFFDIGFGNGMKNKLAEAKAKGEHLLAKKYVSSTYAVIILMWTVILGLFILINPHLNWVSILNVSDEYSKDLQGLVWISVLGFGFMFVLRLLTSVINADQRPAIASFIDMLGQLLSLAGIFILVKTSSPSLMRLGVVVSLSPVIIYCIASLFLYRGRYRAIRPSFKFINLKLAGNMMNLGVKFFLATIASLVITQTLNLIIIQITGPDQVANYDTAYRLFSLAYNVMAIIIFPYWTSFTDAYTLKDFAWMKRSIKKLYQLFGLFLIFQLIILMLSGLIFKIWVADRLEIPFVLSAAVCLYVCVLCWSSINIYPLNGIGKIQLQLYSSILEVILFIPLAIWMGRTLETPGIVLAPVLIYIPRMIWAPIQLNKLLNQKATGLWNK
ncbi:MATE family efflux transporter [Bacteroidales bacterium OttesenSCG-928-J19]|nr:MATE family efflux transporter [Bacteroidales bacterium OttesenSCG-928-J19]